MQNSGIEILYPHKETDVCNFASMIVMKNETVHCFPGIDAHHEILELAGISDIRSAYLTPNFAKIEIIPVKGKEPNDWRLIVDECTDPSWFTASHKRACFAALHGLLKKEAKGCEIVFPDGSWRKIFRINGVLHRKGGPASTTVEKDGSWTEEYYCNGKFHRINGPALIEVGTDGDWFEDYYVKGKLIRSISGCAPPNN